MTHQIVRYGDPVLEQKGAAVTEFNAELAKLVEDMFESMYGAQGVGLAAPQIGISLQLAVIDISAGQDPEAKIVLANPEIAAQDGVQHDEEGCLSIPGFSEPIRRPKWVRVRAQNALGEWCSHTGEDLLARVFCHEIDHLHGVLYLKHISFLKRDGIRRKIRKLRRAGDW